MPNSPPGDGAGCDAPKRLGVLCCALNRDVPEEGAPNSVPGLGDGAAPKTPAVAGAEAPNRTPPAGAAEEAPNMPPKDGATNGDACCNLPNNFCVARGRWIRLDACFARYLSCTSIRGLLTVLWPVAMTCCPPALRDLSPKFAFSRGSRMRGLEHRHFASSAGWNST